MNRKQLILAAQGQDTTAAVEFVIRKDQKFLERKLQSLQQEIEDVEEALEDMLTTNTPISDSTVEVHYAKLVSLSDKMDLYLGFQQQFYCEYQEGDFEDELDENEY